MEEEGEMEEEGGMEEEEAHFLLTVVHKNI